MSYLTKNRLDVTLSSTDVDEIKTAFRTINSNLPFLIGLTKKERMNLPKINVSNKIFVEDVLNAAKNNSHMLPAILTHDGIQKDLELFESLDELVNEAQKLAEQLSDTAMLAGSESLVGALTLYRFFGASAKSGVPGADAVFDKLKERFTNQGTPDPEEPTEEEQEGENEVPNP